MNELYLNAISRQFEAALEMLENALQACPEVLWHVHLWEEPAGNPGLSGFWYILYHTLFWTDLYLSGSVEGFLPPAPFSLDELDPAGLLPERPYTRAELQAYLDHVRQKFRSTLAALTEEQARRTCAFPWGELPFVELLLDNLRHIQEHAAQLSMLLGQKSGWSPRWVAFARQASR